MTARDLVRIGLIMGVLGALHLAALLAYYPQGAASAVVGAYEEAAAAQRAHILAVCGDIRSDMVGIEMELLRTQALMTAVDQSLSDRSGWRKRTSDTLATLVRRCQGPTCAACPQCPAPAPVLPCPPSFRWPWEAP